MNERAGTTYKRLMTFTSVMAGMLLKNLKPTSASDSFTLKKEGKIHLLKPICNAGFFFVCEFRFEILSPTTELDCCLVSPLGRDHCAQSWFGF